MKKSLVAIALASTFAVPAFAADAAPAEHTVTGNMTIASSYRFRGIDQTFGKPALQGGIDYSHSSGLYAGNWNSNVSSGAGYPNGNLEMDFYGGYKTTFGDFGVDVGALYYYYPGSDKDGTNNAAFQNKGKNASRGVVDNKEIYIGASWKFLSLKYSHSIGDYFGVPKTEGTNYLDLSANFDLGDGWGVNGHVGRLVYKGMPSTANYNDYKLGVTKDVSGWVFGASYVGTDAKGDCAKAELYCFSNAQGTSGANGSATINAGKPTLVLSVTKNF